MTDIYFDNAATTKMDVRVVEAMLPYLQQQYGNPSSTHSMGRSARFAVETSRKKIASLLDCPPVSLVFTSGGTESANTAIYTSAWGKGIASIISAPTEHACVLRTVERLYQKKYVNLQYLCTGEHARISVQGLEQLLHKYKRSLVCLMHANNENGTLYDVAQIADICRRHQSIFFSDMVQTIGHYPINLSALKVDMASASAHKFHGPKGIGLLYVREESLLPLITGGGQELNKRAGTENVACIVGMATALEIAMENQKEDMRHIQRLKDLMKEKCLAAGAMIHSGPNEESLYSVINVGFKRNHATEGLLMELDMVGIAASGGSACSAGKGSSHVMSALGMEELVNIRFSFSKYNTVDEVEKVGSLIQRLVATEKPLSIV